MSSYILDTHIIVWFLENNQRLPENIREDIEYMQHEYCVSFLSLIEIDNLRKLGKIKLQMSFSEIIQQLGDSFIGIYFGNTKDLEVLDSLDMKTIDRKIHGDYIDRMLVAISIAHKHIMISADKKFPYYRENGLRLLEI